jgi:hypothetical protein
MQLAGLTQRLSPLLNGLLALQAVASRRGVGDADEHFTSTNTQTGEKKPKWTTLIIIDSQAVKNTCNAASPFDGKKLAYCKSAYGTIHSTYKTIGMGCNMTGGSSGPYLLL